MKGILLLTAILLVIMLTNITIQIVVLYYGVKYYLKKSNVSKQINHNGSVLIGATVPTFIENTTECKTCGIRRIMNEEEVAPLLNNPEYFIMKNDKGLYEVENLSAARMQSMGRALNLFPKSDITFHFFTPEKPSKGLQILENQLKHLCRLTRFKLNRPTMVLIHGYLNDVDSPFNQIIIKAALQNHNINVIVVDWSPIANTVYFSAKTRVTWVGNIAGDYLLRLEKDLKYNLRQVTLVGHSLGAHVAGGAAARTKGRIETVVGLDPAGLYFYEGMTSDRLDKTDAKYVQVIHTNTNRFGTSMPMGHVDFYVNGGDYQAGCPVDIGTCSHSRSYVYYAESLAATQNYFTGRLCHSFLYLLFGFCTGNSFLEMGGYPVRNGKPGKYYLFTNFHSPFGKGVESSRWNLF